MGKGVPKAAGPSAGTSPRIPKTVAESLDGDREHTYPVFSFRHVCKNTGDDWGFNLMGAEAAKGLVDFMLAICPCTWSQVREQTGSGKERQHRIHHDQDVSTIVDEAQEQIAKYYPDWGDQLFRFRVGDTERLWGYRYMGVFYAIWWDPHHKIYPVGREN
jgi:hypothetical protein